MLRAVAVVGAVLISCARAGPMSVDDARVLGTRSWSAPTDEVFDAAWLTLETRGFRVDADDRQAGTLHLTRDGLGWSVDVAALGAEQRVSLAPDAPIERAALFEVLERFDDGIAGYLEACRAVPEWTFDGRRNLVHVPGCALTPPLEWRWLDFDISHREVTVQRSKTRNVQQSTVVLEVDRRRPRSQLLATVKKTMGLALAARQRLTLPDELSPGATRVLDGTSAQELSWYGEEFAVGTTEVRVVLVCPKAEADGCHDTWLSLAPLLSTPSPNRR